jgi:Uma2 family endonuclease
MKTAARRTRGRPGGWLAKLGPKILKVDLPYTIEFHGVTEEVFDELVDENTDAELLDGVMIVHSPASPRHDDLTGFLRPLLRGFALKKKLGRVFGGDSLVHLATCRKVAPDAFFFRRERVPEPLPEQQFEGVPDLVLEALSRFNRREDLGKKRPAYQEAGVAEIWLVDPLAHRVMIDTRHKNRYATRSYANGRVPSGVLPGFWVETSWLWADPTPDVGECLDEILKT